MSGQEEFRWDEQRRRDNEGFRDLLKRKVTVTPSGSDKPEACKTYYNVTSEKIEFIRDVGRGDCQTISRRYTFGLKYKRFLSTFESGGYVIGMDKESDTPSISGGTCTKIR
jgi:hypothetical protein